MSNSANNIMLKIVFAILIVSPVFENKFKYFFVRYIDDIVMIVLAFLFIIHLYSFKVKKNWFWVMLICAALVLCSFIVNRVPVDVFAVQSRSYILPILAYLGLRRINNDVTANYIIQLIKIIYIIIGFSVVVEMYTGVPFTSAINRYGEQVDIQNHGRHFSIVGNPVDFGCFIVVSMWIFLLQDGRMKRQLWIISGVFLILLSGSRGPMLALMFAGSIMMIYLRLYTKVYVYALSIIVAPAIVSLASVVLERFSTITYQSLLEDTHRFAWLLKSFQIIYENWLLGVGFGRFGGWVSVNYSPSPIYGLYNVDTDGIASIDMFWPHFISEVGIVVAIMSAFLVFNSFRRLVRYEEKGVWIATVSSCFAIAFTSISLETQIITNLVMVVAVVLSSPKVISRGPELHENY